MSSQDVRRKMMERRVLTPTEREGLEEQQRRIEMDMRGDTEGVPRQFKDALRQVPVNRDLLNKESRRISGTLRGGEAENISQADRVALERDAKELEERLKKGMAPRSAMALKPGSIEFRKAVNHTIQGEMSPAHSALASRWKNIQRTLHPDDSEAANLERIRPN